MTRFVRQLLLFSFAGLLFLIQPSIQDQSISDISSPGHEFVPIDSSHRPLLTFMAKKLLYCYLQCNQLAECRTFDFDSSSQQCRLWDGDLTTGSIAASPSKPQSVVGTIRLSSSNYVNINNQTCDACAQSRYETCDTNSNTCQCPSNTFWNGSMCLPQLFLNQTCSQADACRSDLNLTCQPSCDFTYRCSAPLAIGVGQTVAGFCNATIGSGSNDLKGPWGIYVPPSNGSLYVADYDGNKYQVFPPFSRTGQTFFSNGGIDPTDVFVDSSGTIYMTVGGNNPIVNIQQAGVIVRTVPSTQGTWSTSCYLYQLYSGYSAAVDGSGNIYVSLYYCGTVVKWAPNATSGTLVVTGLSTAVRFIVLGENRSALYVSDAGNNRIQKFIIGGNGTGITVAGGNGAGTNLNQLKSPAGIRVTSDGQTLYIADYGNNRIVKWTIGASQGEVVAGSASGTAGSTSQLLNQPAGLALDPSETYVYVADYNNYRVQRFRVQ